MAIDSHITCYRCGINIFEHFCYIIDRFDALPPNTPIDKYSDLLPDRWKKHKDSRPKIWTAIFL